MIDQETSILTKTGWKTYDELTISDCVMQWDKVSGKLTWGQVGDVVVKDYSGYMIHITNNRTDQLLTPGHLVLAKYRKSQTHKESMVYSQQYAGNHSKFFSVKLPLAGVYSGEKEFNKELAYIIGWWLTDAYIHSNKKGAVFTQSKPKTLKKLAAALQPYNPKIYVNKPKKVHYNPEHTFYLRNELGDYLLEEWGDREITWDVLNWNLTSRLRLLDGLMDGDGTEETGRQYKIYAKSFWSRRPHRRSIFGALTACLGYRTYENLNKYAVYFNTQHDYTTITKKHHQKPVKYSGKIWTIKCPHGAFLAKRNTKIFITNEG